MITSWFASSQNLKSDNAKVAVSQLKSILYLSSTSQVNAIFFSTASFISLYYVASSSEKHKYLSGFSRRKLKVPGF